MRHHHGATDRHAPAIDAHAARGPALRKTLVGADESLRLGVFDELAEPDRVLPRALEPAAELAGFPPEVYARTKRELRHATSARLHTAAAEDPLLARWIDDGRAP